MTLNVTSSLFFISGAGNEKIFRILLQTDATAASLKNNLVRVVKREKKKTVE